MSSIVGLPIYDLTPEELDMYRGMLLKYHMVPAGIEMDKFFYTAVMYYNHELIMLLTSSLVPQEYIEIAIVYANQRQKFHQKALSAIDNTLRSMNKNWDQLKLDLNIQLPFRVTLEKYSMFPEVPSGTSEKLQQYCNTALVFMDHTRFLKILKLGHFQMQDMIASRKYLNSLIIGDNFLVSFLVSQMGDDLDKEVISYEFENGTFFVQPKHTYSLDFISKLSGVPHYINRVDENELFFAQHAKDGITRSSLSEKEHFAGVDIIRDNNIPLPYPILVKLLNKMNVVMSQRGKHPPDELSDRYEYVVYQFQHSYIPQVGGNAGSEKIPQDNIYQIPPRPRKSRSDSTSSFNFNTLETQNPKTSPNQQKTDQQEPEALAAPPETGTPDPAPPRPDPAQQKPAAVRTPDPAAPPRPAAPSGLLDAIRNREKTGTPDPAAPPRPKATIGLLEAIQNPQKVLRKVEHPEAARANKKETLTQGGESSLFSALSAKLSSRRGQIEGDDQRSDEEQINDEEWNIDSGAEAKTGQQAPVPDYVEQLEAQKTKLVLDTETIIEDLNKKKDTGSMTEDEVRYAQNKAGYQIVQLDIEIQYAQLAKLKAKYKEEKELEEERKVHLQSSPDFHKIREILDEEFHTKYEQLERAMIETKKKIAELKLKKMEVPKTRLDMHQSILEKQKKKNELVKKRDQDISTLNAQGGTSDNINAIENAFNQSIDELDTEILKSITDIKLFEHEKLTFLENASFVLSEKEINRLEMQKKTLGEEILKSIQALEIKKTQTTDPKEIENLEFNINFEIAANTDLLAEMEQKISMYRAQYLQKKFDRNFELTYSDKDTLIRHLQRVAITEGKLQQRQQQLEKEIVQSPYPSYTAELRDIIKDIKEEYNEIRHTRLELVESLKNKLTESVGLNSYLSHEKLKECIENLEENLKTIHKQDEINLLEGLKKDQMDSGDLVSSKQMETIIETVKNCNSSAIKLIQENIELYRNIMEGKVVNESFAEKWDRMLNSTTSASPKSKISNLKSNMVATINEFEELCDKRVPMYKECIQLDKDLLNIAINDTIDLQKEFETDESNMEKKIIQLQKDIQPFVKMVEMADLIQASMKYLDDCVEKAKDLKDLIINKLEQIKLEKDSYKISLDIQDVLYERKKIWNVHSQKLMQYINIRNEYASTDTAMFDRLINSEVDEYASQSLNINLRLIQLAEMNKLQGATSIDTSGEMVEDLLTSMPNCCNNYCKYFDLIDLIVTNFPVEHQNIIKGRIDHSVCTNYKPERQVRSRQDALENIFVQAYNELSPELRSAAFNHDTRMKERFEKGLSFKLKPHTVVLACILSKRCISNVINNIDKIPSILRKELLQTLGVTKLPKTEKERNQKLKCIAFHKRQKMIDIIESIENCNQTTPNSSRTTLLKIANGIDPRAKETINELALRDDIDLLWSSSGLFDGSGILISYSPHHN